MKLSRMQDIGGLRAVVDTLESAQQLRDRYIHSRHARFEHTLVAERDYIVQPKTSGYRSVHLVYRYRNSEAPDYDGLLLELQIRSRRQHIWATAVETMGTFLNRGLKASEGPEEWLNFFALTGSAFAHLEKSPPVPGYEHLSAKDTYIATIEAAMELQVRDRLQAYSIAAEAIQREDFQGSYHLIVLDPVAQKVFITPFSRRRIEEANQRYTEVEKRITDGEDLQAVLVSAGPISQLRRAYPNYFLDTREFVKELGRIEGKL